jgi:hypothetical protein
LEFGVANGGICERHDGISCSIYVYTVKNTVKVDGMSIEFIGTHRKRKTPISLSGLGV